MNDNEYQELKERLHDEVLSGVDYSRSVKDEEILHLIDEAIIRAANDREKETPTLTLQRKLRQELFHTIRRLDVLQELLDQPDITEIMINGENQIFIEKAGTIKPYPSCFVSKEKLEDVIQQIVGACNRVVNEASPMCDCRIEMAGGARVNVVLPPIALNGPIVTIRRFPTKPMQMKDLIAYGSISEEIVRDLSRMVRAGMNIFVSGGTGSGKTTFLGALSAFIPEQERIITIEDNAELQIVHAPNLVRLEARNANVEGCAAITIRDLIKCSLRMRPDRVIVGEVRGAEAIDMMQAMNTGHDGSMSTGHANSAKDMLSRLETMILMGMDLPMQAVRGQLSSGIDIIVHLGRLRDRSRRMLEMTEVTGMENGEIKLHPLYRFYEKGEDENGHIIGTWQKEGELQRRGKLELAGLA